jgi:hypothetical protein
LCITLIFVDTGIRFVKCDIYDLVIWHRGGIRLQLMEADGGRWRSMEVKKSYYRHLLEVKRPY